MNYVTRERTRNNHGANMLCDAICIVVFVGRLLVCNKSEVGGAERQDNGARLHDTAHGAATPLEGQRNV